MWVLVCSNLHINEFYRVQSLAARPTPNLEGQVSLFVWVLSFDLSGKGGPTSSYATKLVKNYRKFDSIKDVPHCRHIAQVWLRLFFFMALHP